MFPLIFIALFINSMQIINTILLLPIYTNTAVVCSVSINGDTAISCVLERKLKCLGETNEHDDGGIWVSFTLSL